MNEIDTMDYELSKEFEAKSRRFFIEYRKNHSMSRDCLLVYSYLEYHCIMTKSFSVIVCREEIRSDIDISGIRFAIARQHLKQYGIIDFSIVLYDEKGREISAKYSLL